MPVVTPSLASMDSVNAVPKFEVFSADMGGRRRWSRRSSVMARQTRPRPYLAMKLMASGVIFSAAMVRSPSFSRSSSSMTTIMRPARISSSAVSTSQNREGLGMAATSDSSRGAGVAANGRTSQHGGTEDTEKNGSLEDSGGVYVFPPSPYILAAKFAYAE